MITARHPDLNCGVNSQRLRAPALCQRLSGGICLKGGKFARHLQSHRWTIDFEPCRSNSARASRASKTHQNAAPSGAPCALETISSLGIQRKTMLSYSIDFPRQVFVVRQIALYDIRIWDSSLASCVDLRQCRGEVFQVFQASSDDPTLSCWIRAEKLAVESRNFPTRPAGHHLKPAAQRSEKTRDVWRTWHGTQREEKSQTQSLVTCK